MLKTLFIALLLLSPFSAQALDPLTAPEYKDKGMLVVEAPLSDNTITITNTATGATQNVTPNTVNWVSPGNYNVTVKMQDYTYNQNVLVKATERTDAQAIGYGAIKVNTPSPSDMIEVVAAGSGNSIAKFPSSQTKIVPTGTYNVKIQVGSNQLTQSNILVVTNTTREINVQY